MYRSIIQCADTRQIPMQRSRIKKRRPFWPWFLLLALIFAGGGYALASNLFSTNDTPSTKTASSKKSSSSATSSSQESVSSAVSSAITVVNEADAASSESVSSVADSSVASSVLSEVTKDATGEKVPTTPAETSSVTSSTASSAATTSSTTDVAAIGSWTKVAYDDVALGTTTYQNIIASYGAPTYLTSDQKYAYAVWQGTNDANVTIVFTPTDAAGTLIASTKSYKGLQ